jgi:hypothetical protein
MNKGSWKRAEKWLCGQVRIRLVSRGPDLRNLGMDLEIEQDRRTRWPRWTESGYLDRFAALLGIRNSGGSELGFMRYATNVDVSGVIRCVTRGDIRWWKSENNPHRGQLPKAVALELDAYLVSLKRRTGDESETTSHGVEQAAPKPFDPSPIRLRIDLPVTELPELITCSFRAPNFVGEDGLVAICCHFGAKTIPFCKGWDLGVRRFSTLLSAGDRPNGQFRRSAPECELHGGYKITRAGVHNAPEAVFESMAPAGPPLRLDGFDPAISLYDYQGGRAGETITIELVVWLEHDFVYIPTSPEGEADPGDKRNNKLQLRKFLSARTKLGDLSKFYKLSLVFQALNLERVESE